jgi:hypothetical protein
MSSYKVMMSTFFLATCECHRVKLHHPHWCRMCDSTWNKCCSRTSCRQPPPLYHKIKPARNMHSRPSSYFDRCFPWSNYHVSIWQVIHHDFWLILLAGCLNTPFFDYNCFFFLRIYLCLPLSSFLPVYGTCLIVCDLNYLYVNSVHVIFIFIFFKFNSIQFISVDLIYKIWKTSCSLY